MTTFRGIISLCAIVTLTAGPAPGAGAVPESVRKLADPDWNVRIHAALAIGESEFPPREAVPALVKALHDRNLGVRRAASWALARIGTPAAPALIKTLDTRDPVARMYAIDALARLDEDREAAIEKLATLVRDPEYMVGRAAALALRDGSRKSEDALVSVLAEILSSPAGNDTRSRKMAAFARRMMPRGRKPPERAPRRNEDTTAPCPVPSITPETGGPNLETPARLEQRRGVPRRYITPGTGSIRATDWPRFRGPDGTGVSPETGLARSWPKSGPPILWKTEVEPGFGGAAISKGEVFVMDRAHRRKDVLSVLDLGTGKEKWQFSYDARGRLGADGGSRTVPTIHNGHIYIMGPNGRPATPSRTTTTARR